LVAWNPVTQKVVWKVPYPTSANGGVMVTGGGLVFQGTVDGTFNAYSATTGKLLWFFAAQAPLIAPPISYAVNGRQHVTVLTGLGTSAGIVAAGIEKYGIDPRTQARRVLTFTLDGHATLPPAGSLRPSAVEDPEFTPDARTAEAGQAAYNRHCLYCHGSSVVSGSHAPDPRRSAIPLAAQAFARVVRDGEFVANGMPAFGEFTDEQLANIRQYIRTEAERMCRSSNTGT
jgi:quinohemoprotein ethanol dehydrogenase